MSAQKIVNKFRKFGLPVDGVAILRNDILAIGDRTIDVHSCNYGYIRTSGRKRYSKGQQITGCDFLNNVTEDLFLVLIIDEGKSLDAYINAARHILDADQDVTILEIDVNKESIQRAESIPPSLNKIARISFQYSYQEVGKCEEGVCEYVADVECDVEPCDSKSFCERVQECIEPVDTDCTLQVGSGCCDYSIDGIELITSSCFIVTFPNEFAYGDEGFMLDLTLEVLRDEPATNHIFFNIQYLESERPTISEFISNIESNFDSDSGRYLLTTGNNWYQICDTQSGVIGQVTGTIRGLFQDATENNIELYGLFNVPPIIEPDTVPELQGGFDFLFGIDTPNTNTFQVLINDTWTDVTDEVENGTWDRTSCDEVITEWRIIDSEDNVIDSGEVTATCDGEEVTDSVCNWLQAHQTAIEELQNNPSGLTCETLPECQTIIDIEQTLTEKANTADLATVATTGSYNNLTDQPTIPAAQIQSDWNQANNAAVDFIKNKPIIPSISGLVPYTGATQDVNLGSNGIDAKFVSVKGTAGTGHLGLKHQSSNATAGGQETVIFAGNDGELRYKNDGNSVQFFASQNWVTGLNYITLAQARAGGYTRFFADFTATSVNTNTTNNVIGSVLIPAKTITGNAILEIESAISRATGGANPQHRLYINTSASFGGTQIGSIGIGTTLLWSKGERSFKVGANSLRGFSFTTAAAIDDNANINAPSATTPDWTVDQYILTVANNAIGETTTHEYTTIKVLTV